MPLPIPPVEREKFHTRSIRCEGYARADGLWDIEAHMTDVKSYVFRNSWRGEIPVGEPIHEMWLRLTVDDRMEIRDVEAVTDNSPFEMCPRITPNFKRLIGLRIGPGWHRKVKELLGGVQGCTHLTELLGPLATVAFQTINTGARPRRDARFGLANPDHTSADDRPASPAILDTCHAWARESEEVREFMPEHYVAPGTRGNAQDRPKGDGA